MLFGNRNIPGLSPPPVLIFFHIPRTGGTTLSAMLRRGFADKYFDIGFGAECPDTCLWVYFTARIVKKFPQLSMRQGDVRCLGGEHINYDVQTIFDRPSKFVTIVRHPVDRVISSFFFFRSMPYMPSTARNEWWVRAQFIKYLTLEQYLDSGIGLDHDNHQVRMLSGCPELDAHWDREGRPISTPPVERRHLEMAKRNLEERFTVAAPTEQITALVWFLKRLYGWPLHRVFFEIRNDNLNRLKLEDVSVATRKRLEALNQYDVELYEWVRTRFAKQIEPLEPNFSREVRLFDMLNRSAQQILRLTPAPIKAMVKHRLVVGE
jgi:hypothetical protein